MPVQPPTPEPNTRQAIIQAAQDLFVKQGFHGTSMRQIAGAAGIALGGIYNHFDSKEAIFRAIFLGNHPYQEVLPAIAAAEGETIAAWVKEAAGAMLAALDKQPDFLNLMFIELVEFESRHTMELFQDILPQAMAIIQRVAADQSGLRPIPPLMLLRTFLGLFFSYYMTERIVGPLAPAPFRENAMDHYVTIYLHGILDEKAMTNDEA
jgi:AcrR family transcriptional regulator